MALTPFTFTFPDELADLGGNARRFQWNLQALRLLRELEDENRTPTPDEQRVLAHYTAFGSSELLQRAVTIVRHTGHYAPNDDLTGLISDEDAAAIARGALTQYFTPLPVAQTLGKLADRALDGVARPRILEPAAGVGMLVAALPAELRARAEITAIELDKATSRIFAHLHPDVRLYGAQGFEDTELPEDSFDLCISNVPFGGVRVTDPLFTRGEARLCRTLHDFFLAKMLKLTRPGGYVVVLTSYGTMDKKSSAVRSWLAGQARLIGALRLPNRVFIENSGSESGCDILVFRKYASDEEIAIADWIESRRCAIPQGEHIANAVTSQGMDYLTETMLGAPFVPGSPNVLGTYVSFLSRSVRGEEKAFYVLDAPTAPLAELIANRLAALPIEPIREAPITPAHPAPAGLQPVELVQIDPVATKHAARLTSAQAVFLATRTLIAAETEGDDEDVVNQRRAALNTTYDAFVAQYGPFHAPENQKVLGAAILEYPLLLALERNPVTSRGEVHVERAPIFTTRIAAPRRAPAPGRLSVEEALTWCLAERVQIDIPFIAELAHLTPDEAVSALSGRIYRDLSARTVSYLMKDELCSGNVRAKLAKARRLAAADPDAFAEHIEVLEAALPAPLARAQITLTLGNALVGPEHIAQFITSLIPEFTRPWESGTVTFHEEVNAWKIEPPRAARRSTAAQSAWGTERRNFFDIFDAVIHQRELVVRDTFENPDGSTYTKVNPQATLEANEVARRTRERFELWLWENEARASELERVYNAARNSHVERRFDGSHLQLVGLNTQGLRLGDADPHQKDVIWRILSTPATYIAHPVGSGKTLMMVAGIAESLRRGLAHKAAVVVPNSLVGQWAADILRFYPNLRVLAMTSKDFAKGRRQRFMATVATDSWDVVVMGTTTFTRLPLPRAIRRQFYAEEIAALRSYLHELDATDARPTSEKKRDRALKKIEARVEKLEAKLKAIDAGITRDDERLLNLTDLGFDMLIVDEFHLFKNLEFATGKTGIAGLPNGGSERAFDMWQKIRHFQARGHKVVVASATPIANTIAEAFVNMKYLQWELLRAQGLAHFDQWAAQFAKPTQSFELRPDAGGFRIVTRMAQFINLPELHQLTRQVVDVRLEEQLNLPRPKIITGRPIPIVMPASEQLRAYISELGARADAIKNGAVDPEEDNMLSISSDGRHAALDMRLVGGTRDAGNKLDLLAENLITRYRESTPWRGTQIVFCDLGTPKGR
jgi:N12 class adenine-specific DNA methylase